MPPSLSLGVFDQWGTAKVAPRDMGNQVQDGQEASSSFVGTPALGGPSPCLAFSFPEAPHGGED